MASVLSGFADSDAWTYCADGTIVGRARDRSYKEVARGGVPIDVLVAAYVVAEPVTAAAEPAKETKAKTPCGCESCAFVDDYTLPLDLSDDFEQYFKPVVPRSTARARRLAAKKPVKVLKYGPKASKAHTVAARVFLEPVPASDHVVASHVLCEACRRPQCESVYETWQGLYAAKACERCDPKWVAKLAAFQAEIATTLAAIAAEREELREEQRMRDARYRD
jgi:hypothetical protein